MEKTIQIVPKNYDKNKTKLINRIEDVVLSLLEQIHHRKIPKLLYPTLKPKIRSSAFKLIANSSIADDDDDDDDDNNDDDEDNDNWGVNLMYLFISMRQQTLPSSEMKNYDKKLNINSSIHRMTVDFSKKNGRLRMSRMMIILAQAYKHLICEQFRTKRSFYYELKSGVPVNLFKQQNIVERNICHVAILLQCTTWDLGFIATCKGLVAGNLTLIFENGNIINCNTSSGVLIPQIATNNVEEIIGIKYSAVCIIIVEKDSIFQKLLNEDCPNRLGVILITGKGYPDVTTRHFVRLLTKTIKIPIYIFVDANPHGFEIMCVYKYGSINLWWENTNLTCKTVCWIGFLPSELVGLHLPRLPLTDNDKKKLESLEKRLYISDSERNELRLMRQGKGEIESLVGISPNFLTSRYLSMKIQN